jgi:hypothetical protein
MDKKKLPTLLGWKGRLAPIESIIYPCLPLLISFSFFLWTNKCMTWPICTNALLTLPSQQLLGSSSFCYILYSLHLIQIGDTNTSKSRAYTNSNIATTIVPLFWTRNIYQLVNFEDSNSNKIVYASLQMLTTFLLFLNFLIYSGIHVINIC